MSNPLCPCNIPNCICRRPANRSQASVVLPLTEEVANELLATLTPNQDPQLQQIQDIEDLNRQQHSEVPISNRMPTYRIRRPDGRWVQVFRYGRRNQRPELPSGEDVVVKFANAAEMYAGTTNTAPTSDSVHLVYDPVPQYLADHFEITRHLMKTAEEATFSHFHPDPKSEEIKAKSINRVEERLKLSRLPGGALHAPRMWEERQPEPLQEFSNEIARMRSFKRWRCYRANVSRLAFAGFVYNEVANHIECFSCRLTLKGAYYTENKEPVALHLHLAKQCCPHLYSILAETRTLVEGSWFDGSKYCLTRKYNAIPLGRVISNHGGADYIEYASTIQRRKSFEQIYYDPVWKDFPMEEEPTASSLKNMGYMDASKYPTNEELIKAGFFCTNMYTVCCYYCGMKIELWPVNMQDSSPEAVHDLFFPQCFLSQIRSLPPAKPLEYLPKATPEEGELMEEDDGDSQVRADPSRPDCKLCLQNEANILTITCGHVISCSECVEKLKNHECPFCRTKIGGLLQMYI